MNVDCDQGAIINFPLVILALLIGDVDGTMKLEHVDGVFVSNNQPLRIKIGIYSGKVITMQPAT